MASAKKPQRRRYTPAEKAAAVDLFVNGGKSLDDVAIILGSAKTTVRDWLLKAGVDPGAIAAARGRNITQTEEATKARLAKAAADRQELLRVLRERITLPAAGLLAARLDRAAADEDLITTARERWRDALIVEAQAADFGPAAQAEAKKASMRAKVDVMVAEAGAPDVNELSMILNRSVRDLLAIEGYEHDLTDEDVDGRLTVVITAPRPDRATQRVVQLEPLEAS